ncbi:fungal-specific transcription factor domain-containing protein [Trichoderma velutinum]
MEVQSLISYTARRIRPAMHPCQPCKRLKRRCDRELPECSLCTRTHRPCEYPPGSMSASPKEAQLSQSILLDIPINRFPATYFFDRRVFNDCHMSIERGHLPPSSVVLNDLNSTDEIRQVANKYFTSVHLWFPIINRSKFYGSFLHGSVEADVEISLLAMCMQLLGSRSSNGTQAPDSGYVSIRQAFVQLEQAGVLNITVLQALLLTALYEIGNGIYPAAYLTIGNCARYAVALDLDREILNWNHNASDWVMMEEKHRAWWAVLILDRYINIGCPRRALCTPDPTQLQYLPMSDDDWNQGTRISGSPHRLSTPVEVKMGKFARLAQATHLLGRVLRHIRDPTADEGFLSEEREALDRALRSLLSLTVAEEMADTDTAFCSPMALLGRIFSRII